MWEKEIYWFKSTTAVLWSVACVTDVSDTLAINRILSHVSKCFDSGSTWMIYARFLSQLFSFASIWFIENDFLISLSSMKAYELSTLTGTQVMLLVASETGHVYTFATRKLQPMITSDSGKQLIQTCLNSPESTEHASNNPVIVNEQRMSATGFEETELTFDIQELNDLPEKQKVRQPLPYNPSTSHHQSVSQTLPSSHSHLYSLPHPPQHYTHSPQAAHHYSSPHYSPPSPSITTQHFHAPPPSQYPSYYENTGNNTPLSSYQSIRTPSVPISPPVNCSSEATR